MQEKSNCKKYNVWL